MDEDQDRFTWFKLAKLYTAGIAVIVGAFAITAIVGGLCVMIYSIKTGR